MRVLTRVCFTGLLLTCAPALRSQSASAPLAERIISAYSQLETYCDRGRSFNWALANVPATFRGLAHCVTSDGRYKSTLTGSPEDPRTEIHWVDEADTHDYLRQDGAQSWDTYRINPRVDADAASDMPPLLRVIMSWYVPGPSNLAELRRRLNAFQPLPELSTGDLTAYQSADGEAWRRLRIWVSRDGFIRRTSGPDGQSERIELDEISANPVLNDSDLTFAAPGVAQVEHVVKQKLSLTKMLAVALVISLATFVSGFWYWRRRWKHSLSDAHFRAAGTRVWRLYGILWLLSLVPLAALAWYMSRGGDLHGLSALLERTFWLLVYLFVLGLIGLFVLTAHFVASGRRSS